MEWGVFVQRSMRPQLIIIGGICDKDPTQVRFTEHDHVVQALPADRADESLNVRILPGRSGRNGPVSNAHGAYTLNEDRPVRGIPIPNEVSMHMVPWKRLGDLARNPLRGRMARHAERHPQPSSVTYDDKTIEDLERDRRQDKQIDRRDAVGMVPKKRPPALRRWAPAAAHIPGDCRLGDLEAELEQLAMNAWCAPERVRTAHLANERAQLS